MGASAADVIGGSSIVVADSDGQAVFQLRSEGLKEGGIIVDKYNTGSTLRENCLKSLELTKVSILVHLSIELHCDLVRLGRVNVV